ncbi:MAG TPA: hypothetical protein VLJ21_02905 [Candidatus Binatia bacterium]|nr:hypothetical protein [Candidatus Binatia bacterium]
MKRGLALAFIGLLLLTACADQDFYNSVCNSGQKMSIKQKLFCFYLKSHAGGAIADNAPATNTAVGCTQDKDCSSCQGSGLSYATCTNGQCGTPQFEDCNRAVQDRYGSQYQGTCQNAQCTMVQPQGGRVCSSDDDCTRCDGKTLYTSYCITEIQRCDTQEYASDCDAAIGAQYGQYGTCGVFDKKAMCTVI